MGILQFCFDPSPRGISTRGQGGLKLHPSNMRLVIGGERPTPSNYPARYQNAGRSTDVNVITRKTVDQCKKTCRIRNPKIGIRNAMECGGRIETWGGFGGERKLNRQTRVRIFRLRISSLSVKEPIELTRCGLPWSISSASRHWKEHFQLFLNLLAQLGWGIVSRSVIL